MFRQLLLFILLSTLIACQGPKKTVSDSADLKHQNNRIIYLEGKITVEDFAKKKNHTIKIEGFLIKDKSLRIEANGPLGIRVASVLVSENQIQAQLYMERKFLSGIFPNVWKVNNQTLKAISIPVSPKFLQSAFLYEKNLGPDWKCESDAGSEECLNLSAKALTQSSGQRLPMQPEKMTWVKSENGFTRFFAESQTHRLTWEPSAAITTIDYNPKLFVLEANEQFRKVDITPR
ncbi:MAG: hypothetical protein ACK5WZ_03365 [Pseudobdellovibrionaceae bacterium]